MAENDNYNYLRHLDIQEGVCKDEKNKGSANFTKFVA